METHTRSRPRFLAQSATAIGFPMIIAAGAIGRGRPATSSRVNVGVFGRAAIASDWTPSFPINETGRYNTAIAFHFECKLAAAWSLPSPTRTPTRCSGASGASRG